MAELGSFLRDNEADNVEITVDMLDYEYVKSCTDVTKLRGILRLLESGKEGTYPDV